MQNILQGIYFKEKDDRRVGKMVIKILENEYWWGGAIDLGCEMPYDAQTKCLADFVTGGTYPDQCSPLFLSSKGRIIHSDKPFKAEFNNGNIIIDDKYKIDFSEGFENLRGAYKEAAKRYFNLCGKIPDEKFFKVPQYNTWIELMYNQNEKQILEYAHSIVDNKMTPGILMIDEGWSEDYGVFDFYPGRFQNPKKMVDELHSLGFTVMLWITPQISPDGNTFRKLWKTGYLIKNSDGEIAIKKWWNGYSAVLDLSNPKAAEWLDGKLEETMKKYNIDGFKFDAGDSYFYSENDDTYVKQTVPDNTRDYGRFAAKYKFNELRAVWNMGGEPIVCRLQDKKHSWGKDGLKRIIPNTVMQGLMGYFYGCPDMIGGGDFGSFLEKDFVFDEELYLRWLEASVLCPMMQFSVAPWRMLSAENYKIVQEYAKLRERYSDYIISLAKNASETGEPIVRHMEYEFPGEGFEKTNDMFMLGDKYLVVPMLEKGKSERRIMLPKGSWILNGEKICGAEEITLEYDIKKLYIIERVI